MQCEGILFASYLFQGASEAGHKKTANCEKCPKHLHLKSFLNSLLLGMSIGGTAVTLYPAALQNMFYRWCVMKEKTVFIMHTSDESCSFEGDVNMSKFISQKVVGIPH